MARPPAYMVEAARQAQEFAATAHKDPQQFIADALYSARILTQAAASAFTAIEKDLRDAKVEKTLLAFYEFGNAYDAVDEARKAFGAKVEHMKNTMLPEMMDAAKVKTISLTIGRDGVRRFTTNVRQNCGMQEGKKSEAIQWLKDQGQGGLVMETVNAGSLSSFSKQWVTEKGADLPGELFKITTMRYVSVTKT